MTTPAALVGAYVAAVSKLVVLAQEEAERLQKKPRLDPLDCRAIADLSQALAALTRGSRPGGSPLDLAIGLARVLSDRPTNKT